MGRDTHANYLRDLGHLLRDYGADAKREAEKRGTEFDQGRAFAYYEVLSLMQQQAEAFGLPPADLSFERFDADRDLLG